MKYRTCSLLVVAAIGLLSAVVGDAAGWPTGLCVFVVITAMSGSALLLTLLHGRTRTPGGGSEQAPEPEVEEARYHETRVTGAALPSAVDGYSFRFSATVWWRPVDGERLPPDSALSSLASAFIVNRARAIAEEEQPHLASSAHYLMQGALAVARKDGSGIVTAMATDIRLTLEPGDHDRLQRSVELRKEEQFREQERQYERSKRAYLGDEVLKSPGSAVVWWLARHDEEIHRAVDMIGPLAQISAAAKDAEVPELYRHLVRAAPHSQESDADPDASPSESSPRVPSWAVTEEEDDDIEALLTPVIEHLGLAEGSDERTVFIHRVVRTLEAAGRPAAADRVRRAFLPGSADAPGPDASGPGGPRHARAATPDPGADAYATDPFASPTEPPPTSTRHFEDPWNNSEPGEQVEPEEPVRN